jgi:hypothetical protein
MKRIILLVFLFVPTQLMAAVPMARFARVIDSRTIVVEHTGATEVVHLSNVDVPASDERAAREYIEEKLTGTFVYVENGEVYRSPDALFINRELAYRAYAAPSLKMRVLGEVNPAPRAQALRATPVREPMQVPKPRMVVRKTTRKR